MDKRHLFLKHEPCSKNSESPMIITPPWSLLIGLSTSVTLTGEGFAPKPEDHGIPLLGDLRWAGFAAALRGGFAEHLTVVGGDEDMLWGDLPQDFQDHAQRRSGPVNRAQAICGHLERKQGILSERLSWLRSVGNTGGNVAAIVRKLREHDGDLSGVCVTTSFYHLPRLSMDLARAGLGHLSLCPAEAFLVAETGQVAGRKALAASFGSGPLVDRSIAEIIGISDKLTGEYRPKST